MRAGRWSVQSSRYDVFVSYSHQRDHPLAEALQAELQNFARPWHRPRAPRALQAGGSGTSVAFAH
jgi:hypothetical protein